MNQQQLLDELLILLGDSGVTIRHEQLGGNGGGLCDIKGRSIFFIDTQASTRDNASKAALALKNKSDLEAIYIKPLIRQFIESCVD
jgi:hypothetical protein